MKKIFDGFTNMLVFKNMGGFTWVESYKIARKGSFKIIFQINAME